MTRAGQLNTPPLAACVVAVFFIGATAARAACDFEIQGEGRVAAVIDARTLRLEDGSDVRLAGIELPGGADQQSLRDLVLGRGVTLRSTSDTPDRYGRLQAFVFISGEGIALQSRLLTQGWAMASGTVADKGCAAELGAAEHEARLARRGLWASPAAIKNAESTADILAETGRFTLIEGKVVSTREAGATFYINFGKRWIQGFAVMVSRRMMVSFEAAGIKLGALENRRIRVRGFVERRNGAPRIEAFAPGQIELIDESRAAATAGSE